MRIKSYAALLALAGLASAAAPASAREACGPAGATTVAHNAQSRIYVDGGRAAGCDRERRRRYPLGSAARIEGVTLVGHFAAIRRASATGETLRVYDLRRGRAISSLRRAAAGAFTALVLDSKGLAAYVASAPGQPAVVDTTSDAPSLAGAYATGPDIDPSFIGLGGGVLAWSTGGLVHLQSIARGTQRRLLLRRGDVRIVMGSRGVVAQLDGRRAVTLDAPLQPCDMGPGSCYGIDQLLLAGRFVATRYVDANLGGQPALLTVVDLESGRSGHPCPGHVESFVVTETGAAACGQPTADGGKIVSNGAVVDEGPGVASGSLRRRGDLLVWLDGGQERTAPIPG